jgi:S-adenosylmethionine hydrolase
MSIITLTTDYGLKDHYVGVLKGKILYDFPDANIIDISHDIDPFNIFEASYILQSAYQHFPKGTVHFIGVDATRNKENNHVAMLLNGHYFVGADNGIMSLLSQKIIPEQLITVTIHDRLPVEVTDVDVLIKVATHLAKGGLLNVVGRSLDKLKEIKSIQPIVSSDYKTLSGQVIYIDHFGNVVFNITKKSFLDIGRGRPYEIKVKRDKLKTILPNYSDIAITDKYPLKYYEGKLLAVFNEAEFLEIALYRSNTSISGSAASLLDFKKNDIITIQFFDK